MAPFRYSIHCPPGSITSRDRPASSHPWPIGPVAGRAMAARSPLAVTVWLGEPEEWTTAEAGRVRRPAAGRVVGVWQEGEDVDVGPPAGQGVVEPGPLGRGQGLTVEVELG